MKLDTNYLTHKLRPVLQDFCADYDYILPPVEYMSSLTILTAKYIKSNNSANSAYGIYHYNKIIEVKEDIPQDHILITILHELIHAVQHYNIGESFSTVYTHQYKTFGYQDCPLEKQARSAECLLKYMDEDSIKYILQAVYAMIKEGYLQLERRRKEARKSVFYYHYESDEPWYTRNNWRAISAGHNRSTSRRR